MKEYVIWGKSPNSLNLNETLLLTTYQGEKLTSLELTKELADKLEKEYNCTDIRIQYIDFADTTDLFVKSLSV